MDKQPCVSDSLVTFTERSLKIYQVEAARPAIYVTMYGLTQEEINSITKCVYELSMQSGDTARLELNEFSQRIYWEQLPFKAGDWYRVKITLERGSLPAIMQLSDPRYGKQLLLEQAGTKLLKFTALGYEGTGEYLSSTTVSIHINDTVLHTSYDHVLTGLETPIATYPPGAKGYGVFTYHQKTGASDDRVVSNTITMR